MLNKYIFENDKKKMYLNYSHLILSTTSKRWCCCLPPIFAPWDEEGLLVLCERFDLVRFNIFSIWLLLYFRFFLAIICYYFMIHISYLFSDLFLSQKVRVDLKSFCKLLLVVCYFGCQLLIFVCKKQQIVFLFVILVL